MMSSSLNSDKRQSEFDDRYAKIIIDDKERGRWGDDPDTACEEAGVEIPRFCYHERLSIAGTVVRVLWKLLKTSQTSCFLRDAGAGSAAWSRGAASAGENELPMVKKVARGGWNFS